MIFSYFYEILKYKTIALLKMSLSETKNSVFSAVFAACQTFVCHSSMVHVFFFFKNSQKIGKICKLPILSVFLIQIKSLLSNDSVYARIGTVYSGENRIGKRFKMAEGDDRREVNR